MNDILTKHEVQMLDRLTKEGKILFLERVGGEYKTLPIRDHVMLNRLTKKGLARKTGSRDTMGWVINEH